MWRWWGCCCCCCCRLVVPLQLLARQFHPTTLRLRLMGTRVAPPPCATPTCATRVGPTSWGGATNTNLPQRVGLQLGTLAPRCKCTHRLIWWTSALRMRLRSSTTSWGAAATRSPLPPTPCTTPHQRGHQRPPRSLARAQPSNSSLASRSCANSSRTSLATTLCPPSLPPQRQVVC